jgi:RNA polymerase sigma factor (sigma-70 family)
MRDGFAPAFDVVVERYRGPLTRYCARMVGPDHADDVVQETFTAGYTALGADDRPIQLKPWLYRVAHNTAISVLRKRGRQDHDELDENFDGVRQPHEHLEQSQRLDDLISNMRALPERQRTALVLQELEGRSPEEIAAELDGSVPMVRQLVHRARERLRNGVGLLIPLPLILKLFKAENAAAATAKPGGMAVAGGVTGSGAKLAAVLAVGLLAAGGVAVQRAGNSPDSGHWQEVAAGTDAGGATALGSVRAPARSRSSAGVTARRRAHTKGKADSQPAGRGEAVPPANAPNQSDGGDTGSSAPANDGSGSPPSEPVKSPGNTPSNENAGSGGGNAPSSGGGGTQPGGSEPSSGQPTGSQPANSQPSGSQPTGGGEPSGGGQPTGGGGQTPPTGGGTGCNRLLPILPVCLGR